jgi:AsmA protein
MKKLLKWIVRIGATLVILVVIAAVVLPMVIDPNDYKDTIEEKIQVTIGRNVQLKGEIEWKVFPWLALTFNDVIIDNEKGFKGDNMAVIEKLSARVKILPLIQSDIQVGKVTIDQAVFNIQVAKNGGDNYQSILDALDADSDNESTSTESSSGSLNIAGIDFNNISLNYTDQKSKTTANITQLNLNIGEVSAGIPVDIQSSMHLNMPDTGLDVDIDSDIIAHGLLSNGGGKLMINDFNIKGQLSSESKMPLDIELKEAGVFDLAKDSLSLPKILIAAGDANVTSNVIGKNVSTSKSSMSGSYSIGEFDLNKFINDLTGSPAISSDAFSDFSSSGQWVLTGQRFKIDQLAIDFDKTKIKGNADIKNIDRLSGTFNLNINQLNVDKFLGDDAAASQSGTSSESSDNASLNFGHLNGNINIDSLTASGAQLKNVKVKVKTKGSKFELVPVNADFYQGLLSTAVKVDTQATKNKVIVTHKMNKIKVGPLLTDLSGSELLTGIGDLNIDLNIDKPFSELPLKSAHGQINYTLQDGAIYGVDVFGMMKKGLTMIYPELKEEASDGVKKTDFALMQIDADINEGILKTRTMKIESPYLRVDGKVTIDLVNMLIEGTIEPMLLDVPEQLLSDKYKKLLNLPIPVTLSGSLLEPTISIDAKKLLLATQKERIDKEKEKLKGKLLDSLFGKDKKKSKDDG